MKIPRFMLLAGLIGLAITAVFAWYLASPLFIDDVVDETFPSDAPGTEAEERATIEAGLEEVVPPIVEPVAMEPEQQETDEEEAVVATVGPDQEMDEPMPISPTIIAQGQFTGADSFHMGSGSATLYQLEDHSYTLRLEDFTVTNGPDLHVILSGNPAPGSSNEVMEDYLDLGELKGNIGNQNYTIPAGTDISQFKSIVIYCQPFHVIFATATLN